ncbi:MAG: hypothetical protein ACNS63_10740 [Candidatus Nitrospinota bacterium M3_3B_026]
MSAFLGPIHYWMFKKIQTLESRAFAIASALEAAGRGGEVKELSDEYGDRLEGQDLEAILGDNPIHQFLSGLIARVEVLESKLVEAAGDDFGKALEAAGEHGEKTAQAALENAAAPENFEQMYQIINDYQLEGMPCDPGAEVGMTNGVMRYDHSTCNHLPNWRFTGVDVGRMCDITNAWLNGFIKGLNKDASFSVEKTIAKGAGSCRAELKL